MILCDFYPIGQNSNSRTSAGLPISVLEVILIIWIGTIFISEIRTFSINENKVIKAKFKNFFNNSWNTVEYCAVFLFAIGMILRFIPDSYDCYLAARILWCIDIILWFIKILNAYTLNRNLGPILFMIKKMVNKFNYIHFC